MPRSLIALLISNLLCILPAWASGGTGEYPLDWTRSKETLTYHACGCGDACWVAELRNKQTGKLKARLRCDCTALYYDRTPAKSPAAIGSCEAINGAQDKAKAIRAKLEQLLGAADQPQ